MIAPTGPFPVIVAVSGLEIFAQATAPEFAGWFQVLANLGIAGYMLWWFSTRVERHLQSSTQAIRDLERSHDAGTRAALLALSVHRHASQEVRDESARMIAEIDTKAQKRGG